MNFHVEYGPGVEFIAYQVELMQRIADIIYLI